MLTQERLKELFEYEPDTGNFIRLNGGSGKNNRIGSIAGTINKGYIQIEIEGCIYRSHRLAFLYMTGKWPKIHVDHIDGIKHNNKWVNLRECNVSQNQENQKKAQVSNKSTGLLGAYTSGLGFRAMITLNGKQKHLGSFKTAEEAHSAYLTAKRKLHEFNTI